MTNETTYENRFEGAWLVSEYVYSPAGEFCGVVRQTRKVKPHGEGRVRVTQHCNPGSELADGPMAAFRGEHVFDLIPDGHARRYLGPAVIGSGLTWGDGAMTGRGLWPAFGHNFTSFAVMSAPEVQLTGGKFFTGTEMVANIVGIAQPQTSETPDWPTFEGTTDPWLYAESWVGELRQVNADGTVVSASSLHRTYTREDEDVTLVESVDGLERVRLTQIAAEAGIKVSGNADDYPIQGLGKQYGWLTELELCLRPNRTVEWMEVLDAKNGRLVGLRRWWTDAVIDRIDVVNLCAQAQ